MHLQSAAVGFLPGQHLQNSQIRLRMVPFGSMEGHQHLLSGHRLGMLCVLTGLLLDRGLFRVVPNRVVSW
eukprot:4408546-Amphidinium_carterae.1